MKKLSIMILTLLAVITACKKVPEVNKEYVDVERDLITVGATTATIQCDYEYIATLKKAYLYYGEGEDATDMNVAEMSVVQKTLYVELGGLKGNTTYCYYYEFVNGFNSMRSALKTFKTEASPTSVTLPTVITAEVTEITTNSAKSGGEVTNDGGAQVTERGICWSTNANPTLTDNHVTSGTGMGAFTAAMSGLEINTTYHVRAYAINEKGTAYGLDKEFTTLSGGGSGEHEYVDLGMPSGTLWATCNVGANAPEEYGDYFAWGETTTKSTYNWSTYQYANGTSWLDPQLTKYCSHSSCGYNGFTDTLTVLLPEDDAATSNWGSGWCTPTVDQWRELIDNTNCTWTTQNGVNGRLLTASNGNSLFLPAAGHYLDSDTLYNLGISVNYWSSSLYPPPYSHSAWYLSSVSVPDQHDMFGNYRNRGIPVRPVRSGTIPPPDNTPEGAVKGLFTVNANGDQVYFSQGNLQYSISTNTWSFMEHQYDIVEFEGQDIGWDYANQNIVSLFGWGTSGYNHGANAYQPWSTSGEYGDYYAYGNCDYSLYDQTGLADWGYNAIVNGGNMENSGWRTLTQDEWNYLANMRSTISGIRWVRGSINGVNGIIFLPDNWIATIYTLNIGNFESNIIAATDWTSILEVNGAVFLPAAGLRGPNANVYGVGIYGDYWSSSCFDSRFAHSVGSSNDDFNYKDGYSGREGGLSVRLVQNANP